MKEGVLVPKQEQVNVGFISRIDWGRNGFRKGLLDAAFKVFKDEKVNFVVIGGGLISWPALRAEMNKEIKFRIQEKKAEAKANDDWINVAKETEISREEIINEWAKEISKAIPRLKEGGVNIKIYIITSPSPNFDGLYGKQVAERLIQIRRDMRFWGECDGEFPLKQTGKILRVIVPDKSQWRSEYYSHMPDRLVSDTEKQSAKPLPDLWVVGCSASSTFRPKGDARRPIISLPALHVLEEVRTSENAIGARVVRFFDGNIKLDTYTFKDLVSRERHFIPIPDDMNEDEKKVFSLFLDGPKTIGLLADGLKFSKRKIELIMKSIVANKKIPDIVLSKNSRRYDFDTKWLQQNLVYPLPLTKDLKEDSAVSFGCPHFGSRMTDYKFVAEKLPAVILENGAQTLFGVGDFVEGLRHHLLERGEIYAGMNNTDQEKTAGDFISTAILKVFKERFAQNLVSRIEDKEGVRKAVEASLLNFVYIVGNHDAWVKDNGDEPLQAFKSRIIGKLVQGIENELEAKGVFVYKLREIIKEKVSCVAPDNQDFAFPSGVTVALTHPSMARTKTTSIRAQESLGKFRKSQFVAIANFHVAIIVEHWEETLGNRIAVQVGTLVYRTDFEDSKLKTVDFGVICSKIYSFKGRIYKTEVCFAGEPSGEPPLDNSQVRKALVNKYCTF